MPRILLVGAGAGYSTKDLEMGYYEAFQELGIDMSFYLLDRRLFVTKSWLMYQWKYLLNSEPSRKPGWSDVIYRGSVEALEMALRYDVDLVFIISGMYFHADVIHMLRRAGKRVAMLFTESPYLDDQQAQIAQIVDICFTNERTSVAFLRQYNPCTFYIRHAYSPARHFPTKVDNSAPLDINVVDEWQQRAPLKAKPRTVKATGHDVVFVGTGFKERIELLEGVDWSDIDLGLYGNWALLPSRHKLRKYVKGGVMTNMDAHSLYARSTIGLNLYRTSKEYDWKNPGHVWGAESMNPRAYELAAAGIFSLTQPRPEAKETLGNSQPFFTTSDELAYLVCWFLSEPSLRYQRVVAAINAVQGHVFLDRANQVLEYCLG